MSFIETCTMVSRGEFDSIVQERQVGGEGASEGYMAHVQLEMQPAEQLVGYLPYLKHYQC